jgi:small conductance mechanosensitive channel
MTSMLHSLLLAVVLLVTPPAAAGTREGAPPSPATQPAKAGVFASATGGAAAAEQTADNDTFYGAFRRTRVGELVEGKKRVTLDDVRDPLFWVDTLKDLALAVLAFIPRLIVAGLFLIFFWLIYRTLRRLITGALTTAGVDASIRDMLGHLLKWSIMGFGAVIACNQIGVQIAALLTGVSIIGLAVGFAAKETIENFIAGIVIFWDKPFKIGDQVEIEGTTGRIVRVTFRSTRILDGSGKMIVFPNTQMLSKKLSNNTAHPLTAVKVVIGIAYNASIDRARGALLTLVEGDKRICKDPEAAVTVVDCTPASVQLALAFWISDETLEGALKVEYLEKAKKALDAASIEPTAPAAPVPAPAGEPTTPAPIVAPTRNIRAAA